MALSSGLSRLCNTKVQSQRGDFSSPQGLGLSPELQRAACRHPSGLPTGTRGSRALLARLGSEGPRESCSAHPAGLKGIDSEDVHVSPRLKHLLEAPGLWPPNLPLQGEAGPG